MANKVASIKHMSDTRAYIASKEEAGYEDANVSVQDCKKVLNYHKKPSYKIGKALNYLG